MSGLGIFNRLSGQKEEGGNTERFLIARPTPRFGDAMTSRTCSQTKEMATCGPALCEFLAPAT